MPKKTVTDVRQGNTKLKINFNEAATEDYTIIIYGEFNAESYSTFFDYSLFILSSIFLSVILLNIVIAIMSDTYERVMTNIVENDGRQ